MKWNITGNNLYIRDTIMICNGLIYDEIIDYKGDCYDGILTFKRDWKVLTTSVSVIDWINKIYTLTVTPEYINKLFYYIINNDYDEIKKYSWILKEERKLMRA
jgi:hypothetical protein